MTGKQTSLKLVKIKEHSEVEDNEIVDSLAKKAKDSVSNKFTHSSVYFRFSPPF